MSAPAPLQVAVAPQPPFSVAQSAGAQLKPEPCQCGARQTQVDARCVSTQRLAIPVSLYPCLLKIVDARQP
jgi:hypothetical protein